MANRMADDEVAQITSISGGRPPKEGAAAGRATVESALLESPASDSCRPLFPADDAFDSSRVDRKRYAVLPKIKLFQE